VALSFKAQDYRNVRLFPEILNREVFIHRNHPTELSPDTTAYERYWLDQIKKCIEGYWGEETKNEYRYMSGPLYFHINMWTIKIQDPESNSEVFAAPLLRDVEWIIFNAFLCCQGFSGFDEDDTTTCNRLIKKYYDQATRGGHF